MTTCNFYGGPSRDFYANVVGANKVAACTCSCSQEFATAFALLSTSRIRPAQQDVAAGVWAEVIAPFTTVAQNDAIVTVASSDAAFTFAVSGNYRVSVNVEIIDNGSESANHNSFQFALVPVGTSSALIDTTVDQFAVTTVGNLLPAPSSFTTILSPVAGETYALYINNLISAASTVLFNSIVVAIDRLGGPA